MDREWITYLQTLRGRFVERGGPGSGHWGHKGRKGKRGGSARSGARSSALAAMLNAANAKDLDIPDDGALWNTQDKRTGLYASRVMYNPKTGTLLASADVHANTQAKYAPHEKYDDFVKIEVSRSETGEHAEVTIYTDRHQAASVTEAWNMAFESAKVLKRTGFPDSTFIRLHSEDINKRDAILQMKEI